jgi:hypothetical protein
MWNIATLALLPGQPKWSPELRMRSIVMAKAAQARGDLAGRGRRVKIYTRREHRLPAHSAGHQLRYCSRLGMDANRLPGPHPMADCYSCYRLFMPMLDWFSTRPQRHDYRPLSVDVQPEAALGTSIMGNTSPRSSPPSHREPDTNMFLFPRGNNAGGRRRAREVVGAALARPAYGSIAWTWSW